jgi:hypothetical protein
VLVVLVFHASLGSVHAFGGEQLTDPLLSNPVTIDGKFTSNEWSDALQVNMSSNCSGCAGKALLYMKHDASSFYFLEDFISATSLNLSEETGASVTIDSAHDGGSVVGPDDMRFDSSYPYGGSMAIGNGGPDFTWGQGLPGGVLIVMSFSTSPNSAVPHFIAEFRIAFSVFPKLENTIGFAAAAYVCGITSCGSATQLVIWPSIYYIATPTTWGELTLSPTPVPEFDHLWLMMLLPLLIVSLARTRRK